MLASRGTFWLTMDSPQNCIFGRIAGAHGGNNDDYDDYDDCDDDGY